MSVNKDVKKKVKKAAEATAWNPMRALSDLGIRSNHAYTAGLISAGFSLLSWMFSRRKKEDKPQSARGRTFIGCWAPTLLILGVGLKHEE